MLLKIAWRNIWRSRTRSLVVIGAIAVGVWAVIFLISFSTGMVSSYVNSTIQNQLSHIQLHHPDFSKDHDIKFGINNPEAMLEKIGSLPDVSATTQRSLASGMLSSSKGARGVKIQGIVPESEVSVTHLESKIVEGEYLDAEKRNPILISRLLAEKLNVKLRSKMVITFQDKKGEIVAGAFRVNGIFDTGVNAFDEFHVFINRDDLNRLAGDSAMTHEIAVLLDNPAMLDSTVAGLRRLYPELSVQSYKEISPEIELFESQIQLSASIFTVIVMLALIFGIINTMLMAVLERYRELGMLMAIGMNKVRIFLMIMFETILLGLIAAPIGLIIGWLTVHWLNKTGISLSWYSEGMAEFGMAEVVYPELFPQFYGQLAVSVAITAVLASIYPPPGKIPRRAGGALTKNF